jgi:hypothetical protein
MNNKKLDDDLVTALLDEYIWQMTLYEMLNDEKYKERAEDAIKILKAQSNVKQKIVVYNAKIID